MEREPPRLIWEHASRGSLGDALISSHRRAAAGDHQSTDCRFWSSLDWNLRQPSGHAHEAQSGTIEEIEEFRKTGRYVALYFSNAPIPRMPIAISLRLSKNIKESATGYVVLDV